jgi:hypothetical protein
MEFLRRSNSKEKPNRKDFLSGSRNRESPTREIPIIVPTSMSFAKRLPPIVACQWRWCDTHAHGAVVVDDALPVSFKTMPCVCRLNDLNCVFQLV